MNFKNLSVKVLYISEQRFPTGLFTIVYFVDKILLIILKTGYCCADLLRPVKYAVTQYYNQR